MSPCSSPSQEAISSSPTQQSLAVCKTWFTIMFRTACHLSISRARLMQSMLMYDPFQYYAPGHSSSLFHSVSPSIPVYISLLLPICAACPTYLTLLNFITRITMDDEHKSWSTSSHNFLSLLSPPSSYAQLSSLHPTTLSGSVFPLLIEAKFHTCTK